MTCGTLIMTNLGVKPSKTLAIVKVIFGIFLIGIAIYTYLDGKEKRETTLILAIMGVLAVVSGICEFDLAKTERKF